MNTQFVPSEMAESAEMAGMHKKDISGYTQTQHDSAFNATLQSCKNRAMQDSIFCLPPSALVFWLSTSPLSKKDK